MAALGKSKAGELKDVCRNANFYTDGYFQSITLTLTLNYGKVETKSLMIGDGTFVIQETMNFMYIQFYLIDLRMSKLIYPRWQET